MITYCLESVEQNILRRREITVRPDHAYNECMAAYYALYRDRGVKPAHLLLGFETYWNLCLDISRKAAFAKQTIPSSAAKLREFLDASLLIDETAPWRVQAIPELSKSWPQYGRDDQLATQEPSLPPGEQK